MLLDGNYKNIRALAVVWRVRRAYLATLTPPSPPARPSRVLISRFDGQTILKSTIVFFEILKAVIVFD